MKDIPWQLPGYFSQLRNIKFGQEVLINIMMVWRKRVTLYGRKETLFISPVPVTMEATYYENWGAECHICFQNRDFFIENFCDCTGYVCQGCFLAIRNSQGTYVCPFCRHVQVLISRILSASQAGKAKRNWRRCFVELDGEQRILRKMPGFDVKNWAAVNNVLNTGPFWDRRGAGACTELETAQVVVRDQLARFESLTFFLVRMG